MKNIILAAFITLTSIVTPTKPDLRIDSCLIEGLSVSDWQYGTTAATVGTMTSVFLINKDVFHVKETPARVEELILAANPNRENCVRDIPNPLPKDGAR